MDLVFCGTPEFAVPTLEALHAAHHNLVRVVCQPDRPAGRGQAMAVPAVKQRASELGLRVAQPETLRDNMIFRSELRTIEAHAFVVVAYGRILPRWMLELPLLGCFNVHASLLPQYRGAAPIQWAIAGGESVTGVTIMRMDEGMDTGPVLLQEAMHISPEDDALTLAPRLAKAGAKLMVRALREMESGAIQPHPQDAGRATFAPILKKEDGRVEFTRSASEIHNRLRGFQPWPGAYTRFRGRMLRLISVQPQNEAQVKGAPGALDMSGGRLFVACDGGTSLEVLELQPEGRNRMTAQAFLNGYRPAPGEMLGR